MINGSRTRHLSLGRTPAGATAGQGRAAGASAPSLDGPHSSAGYTRNSKVAPTDFARIGRAVPLAVLLNRYGILRDLKRIGSQLAGMCPMCDAGPRAFVVRTESNTWFCFGDCSRGGGVLEFVALREQVSINRAAALIAEWFSLKTSPQLPQSNRRRRAMTGRPSHRAYVIEDREATGDAEQSGFWTKVGSAWPHGDGKGLNIQIVPGLAVSGRLVLREYTEEDAKIGEGKRKPAKK